LHKLGLAIFLDFWHDNKEMQKVEKWRIQELAMMLNHMHELLMLGNNSEWANVFLHFHHEAVGLLTQNDLELEVLKRLIQNIANCFEGFHSFTNLSLGREDLEGKSEWNQDFQKAKGRLISVLTEIDRRTVELRH